MTAEAVVADTDVASHLMRGTLPDTLAAEMRERMLLVTFVTVGELFRGAAHAHWGKRRVAALADWVDRVPVLPGSEDVARRWRPTHRGGVALGTSASRQRRLGRRVLSRQGPFARDAQSPPLRANR